MIGISALVAYLQKGLLGDQFDVVYWFDIPVILLHYICYKQFRFHIAESPEESDSGFWCHQHWGRILLLSKMAEQQTTEIVIFEISH